MKIAVLPLDIVAGDKKANLDAFAAGMDKLAADTDLVVLPELFSTGFTSDRERMAELAESNGGDTMALVGEMARRRNMAVCGSFLARTAGRIYNRAFFVEPSGDETYYDKRHLFSMSSESKILTAGDSMPPIVRFRGWNIALVVCYDLRFPVWCRSQQCSYDLLVVVANWPNSRSYAWTHLLKARAIENQAYVVGANRTGEDKFGDYSGMTLAVDFCGKEIAAAEGARAMYAELDKNALERWRSDFQVWRDADCFDIRL